MEQSCTNCGAALIGGQRFCRFCGAPTDQFPEDNVPTEMMPPIVDPGARPRGATNTAPPSSPGTSPIYNPPPLPYQPPKYRYPMPPYSPGHRSGPPWGWIIALLAIGSIGAMVLGIFLFAATSRHRGDTRRPQDPPEIRSGEATVGQGESEFTKTYTLGNNAKVSIENVNGNISIEGTDEDQAEVKITKRGGSSSDRKNLEIAVVNEGGNLSLRTVPTSNVQVDYEIKLPHKQLKLEINSISSNVRLSDLEARVNVKTQQGTVEMSDVKGDVSVENTSGSIKLSDIQGEVSANSKSGSIELSDINGAASANTVSGTTKVSFADVTRGKDLEFNTVSGSIEIELPSEINADFSARTVSGRIDVDEELGINVEKQMVGQQASGKLGAGGPRFSVKSVSGNIKISR